MQIINKLTFSASSTTFVSGGGRVKFMKKYNHFENEISGSENGQSSFGVFMFQMAILIIVIIVGLYELNKYGFIWK